MNIIKIERKVSGEDLIRSLGKTITLAKNVIDALMELDPFDLHYETIRIGENFDWHSICIHCKAIVFTTIEEEITSHTPDCPVTILRKRLAEAGYGNN